MRLIANIRVAAAAARLAAVLPGTRRVNYVKHLRRNARRSSSRVPTADPRNVCHYSGLESVGNLTSAYEAYFRVYKHKYLGIEYDCNTVRVLRLAPNN